MKSNPGGRAPDSLNQGFGKPVASIVKFTGMPTVNIIVPPEGTSDGDLRHDDRDPLTGITAGTVVGQDLEHVAAAVRPCRRAAECGRTVAIVQESEAIRQRTKT